MVQPYAAGASPAHIKRNLRKEFPQSPGRGSSKGDSFRDSPRPGPSGADTEEQRRSPLVLAADASASLSPHLEKLAGSPGRVRAMARNFSRHGCFYSDDEQGGSEALLERASFYSDSSEKRVRESLRRYRGHQNPEDLLPSGLVGRHTRYQPMEPNCTVLTQLEGENESVSLGERGSSRRHRLAREREELERELEGYACGQRGVRDRSGEERRAKSVSPLRSCYSPAPEPPDDDPVWKPQEASLRPRNQRPSSLAARRVSDYRRGCYFGAASTSSPLERPVTPSASHITWDISPVSSPTSLVPPTLSLSEGNTPHGQRPLLPLLAAAPHDSSTDGSRSPATCLTLLSPAPHSPMTFDPGLGRSRWPEPDPSAADLRDSERADVPRKTSASPVCSDRLLTVCENVRRIEAEQERSPSPRPPSRPTSPSSPAADATPGDQERPRGPPSRTPSSYSTLPYEQRGGAPGGGEADLEREALRARSRESERLALGLDSSTSASPLPLLESVSGSASAGDQSTLSRMCESMKARLGPAAPSAARTSSPVQTSAILEYLSMPGFIEMSVDEPVDESDAATTVWPSADPEASSLLSGEPDVVPRNWEVHTQDGSPPPPTPTPPSRPSPQQQDKTPMIPRATETPVPWTSASVDPSSLVQHRPAPQPSAVGGVEEEEEENESRPHSAQPLLSVGGLGSPARHAQRMGSDLAHTLVSAARSVAAVATRSPERSERFERLPLQTRRQDEVHR